MAVLVVRGLGRGAGPGRLAGLAAAAVRAAPADRCARPMRGARGALAAALVAPVHHWVQVGCRSNHSVISSSQHFYRRAARFNLAAYNCSLSIKYSFMGESSTLLNFDNPWSPRKEDMVFQSMNIIIT